MTVLFQDDLIFHCRVGDVSIIAGQLVRAKDVDVLLDGIRAIGVVEAGITSPTGEVRRGTIRFRDRFGNVEEPTATTVEVVVHDPAGGGTDLRHFIVGDCTWTAVAPDREVPGMKNYRSFVFAGTAADQRSPCS